MSVAYVAEVLADVVVVAVVGFVAALALGMVVGRKRWQEMRILVVLVALLGVAGLVHGVRVAARPYLIAQTGGGTSSAPGTTTVPPTTITPTATTPTTTPPAEPRDLTAQFIGLIGSDNYVPSGEMEEYGAAGTNSRGTWPCHIETGKVVWTYPLGGEYKTFHAVARLAGAPKPWPNTTFTVYTDEERVFTAALHPVDKTDAPTKFAPIDVELAGVQTLRLEVTVDSTKSCHSLIANWSEMKVT